MLTWSGNCCHVQSPLPDCFLDLFFPSLGQLWHRESYYAIWRWLLLFNRFEYSSSVVVSWWLTAWYSSGMEQYSKILERDDRVMYFYSNIWTDGWICEKGWMDWFVQNSSRLSNVQSVLRRPRAEATVASLKRTFRNFLLLCEGGISCPKRKSASHKKRASEVMARKRRDTERRMSSCETL